MDEEKYAKKSFSYGDATFGNMTKPLRFMRQVPSVEAIQFTGGFENIQAIEEFFGGPRRIKTKITTITSRTSDSGDFEETLDLEFEMEPYQHAKLRRGDWLVRMPMYGEYRTFELTDEYFCKEFDLTPMDNQ